MGSQGINFFKLEYQNKTTQLIVRILTIMLIMFVFLVSLKMMGGTFKHLGKETAEAILRLTKNPFVGLFIGLLATAIIQSSSTTTVLIVGLVGTKTILTGQPLISIEHAVPMIMGANIGTSVTSTIVSLGHLTDRNEFKNAIAGATVHDIFNIFVTLVLLPLQLLTKFLSKIAIYLVDVFKISGTAELEKSKGIMGYTVKPVAKFLSGLLPEPWLVILLSIILLFISLRYLTKILKNLLIGKSQETIQRAIFGSPVKAVLWGAGITAAVQSSSVTTSMTVPLVASDKLSLKKAFPFLLGANIGTTITALLASLGTEVSGVTIAVCHFLFNLLGVLLFMLVPKFSSLPVKVAEAIGALTLKNRIFGFVYIIGVFFLLPFTMIYFSGISYKDIVSEK